MEKKEQGSSIFFAKITPMCNTKPFGLICLKLCFPQKTLFSSELSQIPMWAPNQKGERVGEHSNIIF